MPDLLKWIVLGAVTGCLARWAIPRSDRNGAGTTITLGVVGAVVGGIVGILLPIMKVMITILAAAVGTIIILVVARRMKQA